MDMDLVRLGSPSNVIWSDMARQRGTTLAPGEADRLARESRQRYRSTVLQLGLGLSSFLLEVPTSGGAAAFDLALEGAYTPVSRDDAGYAPAPFGPELATLPVRGAEPDALRLAAFHVRKPLPHGLELGARAIWVDQSEMAALQGEIRWVVNESWWHLPDFALRAAYTRLVGLRDLDLGVLDLDATVGKRFGVAGVMRLTPYGALRVTALSARTPPVDFRAATCGPGQGSAPASSCAFPDGRPNPQVPPAQYVPDSAAAFPEMGYRDHRVLRWALGLQLDAASFSVAGEATFQDAKTFDEKPGLEAVKVPMGVTGSLRLALHL
jgi:hypothetical protein